jgi:hypothetical protein
MYMSVLKCGLCLFDVMNLVIGAIMGADIYIAALFIAGLLVAVDGSKPELASDMRSRNLTRAIHVGYTDFKRDLNDDSILFKK